MNAVLETARSMIDALPGPLMAFLIILVGWLGAKAVRFVLAGFLRLARFEKLSEKTGFSEFLRKGNVKYGASKLVGTLAYWIVIVLAFIRSSRELDAVLSTTLSSHLVELVPRALAAGFIIVIGAIIMAFFANFALTIARNAAWPNAKLLSKSIQYAGNALVVAIALEQMGLGLTIISSMFLLVFGAVVFGAALAFGLGCKDMAKDAMSRMIRNLRERERESKGSDLEG